MCGIIGAVGRPVDDDCARAVLDALRHRGPDDEGAIQRGPVWLGFRRLAVLDLRAVASQPMVHEATGVAIVFNGEIYNYVELRNELAARGHTFRTTGDTEVLLTGYLEWGDRVVERCNGMFAVAIDDPRREGVLLSRDRFGEKPLHVGRDNDGRWWFGSELAALTAAGAGSARADRGRIAAFLGIGDIEDPTRSYVEGIFQVAPGTTVHLTDRGVVGTRRWWSPEDLLDERQAPPTDEEVRAAFDDSVRLRLRSDVEVGTSLSGGLDSSSVVAAVRAVDPGRPLHGFTASFPGHPLDEWRHAASVAATHDVELHRVEPTLGGFLGELDLLVERQGAPFESPTVYAQWCVMRAARDAGVTVLLDGQGADETWGGYPKYFGFVWMDELGGGHVSSALRLRRTWRALGPVPAADYPQGLGVIASPKMRQQAASVALRRRVGVALADVVAEDPFGGVRGGGVLDRVLRADLGRTILPRLLRYADRNSMAWGREVRLPFLDPALVQLAISSNWRRGLSQGWTKFALRSAMTPRLPAEIAWRRDKVAYQTPDDVWLRDPRLVDAVAAARRDLVIRGLARGDGTSIGAWRALTLSRFLDRYRLSA